MKKKGQSSQAPSTRTGQGERQANQYDNTMPAQPHSEADISSGVAPIPIGSGGDDYQGPVPNSMDKVDDSHLGDATVPEVTEESTVNDQTSDAVVPMVRVYLMQSVRVAPHQSLVVPVQIERGWCETRPLLLQQDESEAKLSVDEALLQPDRDGRCHTVLTNLSGYTQRLGPGDVLGHVDQVEIVRLL